MGKEFFDLPLSEQERSLIFFARKILERFALESSEIKCIRYGYNATFSVVTVSAQRYALRVNINSTRTLENVRAEIEWVRHLNRVPGVNTPTPIATASGEYVVSMHHEASGQCLFAVLYSWLEGEEIGDNPTVDQLAEVGRALARLHQTSMEFKLSPDSALPTFNSFFWGSQDYLFSEKSSLNSSQRALVEAAHGIIMNETHELYANSPVHLIHADFHGWNLMWNEQKLWVFDFDNSGFGVQAQDLAVALYYLDTPDQDAVLLAGYQEVKPLPTYTELAMKALLLQRRLLFLNYLFETMNPEHKAMLPAYLDKALEKVTTFLTDVRG